MVFLLPVKLSCAAVKPQYTRKETHEDFTACHSAVAQAARMAHFKKVSYESGASL
jgi:hypothetical protein